MRRHARGVRRTPGEMNKLEAAYAHHLELMKRAGAIRCYLFEGITLHLAKRTSYRPDFAVMNRDDELEIHEVKGHWEDDARVKIKVAAEKFHMLRFKAITKEKGQWVVEEFLRERTEESPCITAVPTERKQNGIQ